MREQDIAHAGPFRGPGREFWESLGGINAVPERHFKALVDFLEARNAHAIKAYMSDPKNFPHGDDAVNRQKKYACVSLLLHLLSSDKHALERLETGLRKSQGSSNSVWHCATDFLWGGVVTPPSANGTTWKASLSERFPDAEECVEVLFSVAKSTRTAGVDVRGTYSDVYESLSSIIAGGVVTSSFKVEMLTSALIRNTDYIAKKYSIPAGSQQFTEKIREIARQSYKKIQSIAGLSLNLSEKLIPTDKSEWSLYETKEGGIVVSTGPLERFLSLIEKHKRGEMTWIQIQKEMGYTSVANNQLSQRISAGCPAALLPIFQRIGVALIDAYLSVYASSQNQIERIEKK